MRCTRSRCVRTYPSALPAPQRPNRSAQSAGQIAKHDTQLARAGRVVCSVQKEAVAVFSSFLPA
eukprot:8434834-Lingulodinium_polyedra.AAC.1